MERIYLTVTALNRYLKYRFDHDDNLQKILLKAEISNFKRHSRGHLYLTLKDDLSQVSAIMFASNTRSLNFNPKDGDKVIIEGNVSVYEPYGTYQIYINKMDLDGVGNLYLAYEKLKAKLEEMGMFKKEHKVSIPKYPKVIGVVTSPTGAAIRDIINIINIRYPLVKIIIYPALVQGVNAKESISKQINLANKDNLVDVLIVGRGGGSIEDLWGFNEEVVARSIYASKIPIISAVGHETDFTIADFVSDVRASTPSHAAELAVPSKKDIYKILDNNIRRMEVLLGQYIESKNRHFNQIIENNYFKNPSKIIENKKLSMIYLEERLGSYQPKKQIENYKNLIIGNNRRLNQAIISILNESKNSFIRLNEKLDLVNPLSIMKKGYTIVKQDDVIKNSIDEVSIDKKLTVSFYDGELDCTVLKKRVRK